MTSPTLPNADELEVVAWAETATMGLHPKHRKIVADAGTVLREGKDKFTALVTASALSSAQAQIERLTRERDEALAEIERMTPKFVAYDYLEAPSKAEAAEAEVKLLRTALVDAVAWINESYRAWAPEGIGEPSAEPYSDGEPSRMGALMSALSGGTSNG
jgi:hypothetical protein